MSNKTNIERVIYVTPMQEESLKKVLPPRAFQLYIENRDKQQWFVGEDGTVLLHNPLRQGELKGGEILHWCHTGTYDHPGVKLVYRLKDSD